MLGVWVMGLQSLCCALQEGPGSGASSGAVLCSAAPCGPEARCGGAAGEDKGEATGDAEGATCAACLGSCADICFSSGRKKSMMGW